MSVFRFQASPTSSKSVYKRTRGKSKDSLKPTFAFSTSPSMLQDITLEKAEIGLRNSASSGLTMKEYEEQLKKLTAENFNLKLRVYFVEERLSKVTGISDKEDLIKKNIQLKITCESQLKELEKKQELLFEASKAFELLQKEHSEEVEKLMKEKEKEIADWEEKFIKLEAIYNEIKSKFPALENLNDPDVEVKTFEDYEKQIAELYANLRNAEDRNKELENMIKDVQLESESYELKAQRMESEMNQRMHRAEELVDELEQKEHDLASANFKIRKLEDDLKSKQREVEIMKERIEEKNKTIESLKNSLASRYDTIESLENRIAKEKSSAQSMQSKLDGLSFQNVKLKEELEILQSRLRRTTEIMSPRVKGRAMEDEGIKKKYEDLLRTMEEQESQTNKRIKELEEKLGAKSIEAEAYRELLDKHKKLEDDHRKACTALKNFIKRSTDEKKEREILNHMLSNHEEVIADLKTQLDRFRNNSIPKIIQDDKLSLAETGDNAGNPELQVPENETRQGALESPVQDSVFLFKMENGKGMSEGNDIEEDTNCTYKKNGAKRKMSDPEKKNVLDTYGQCAVHSEAQLLSKPASRIDLAEKKCNIEKLNGELKNRNIYLQQMVNRELLEKNRQIEKLENRLTEMSEVNSGEIKMLQREIYLRDHELNLLQNKLQALSVSTDCSAHLECKLLLGVAKTESFNTTLGEVENEINVWSTNHTDEDSKPAKKEVAYSEERVDFDKGDAADYDKKIQDSLPYQGDAASGAVRMCSLLSLRLEELAAFLDSLLKNNEVSNSITLEKREDIKQAVENTLELSRHLSVSFAKKNLSDTAIEWDSIQKPSHVTQSTIGINSYSQNSKLIKSKDRVISEQSLIISRLRDQVKILNQEIKQRDVELTHCQGLDVKIFGCGGGDDDDLMNISDRDGIEKQTLSICQDLSDDVEYERKELSKEWEEEKRRSEISCKKALFSSGGKSASGGGRSREASESEGWSEPDRSVSLARMGKLNSLEPNFSQRSCKKDDSSDSSQETLNEGSKVSGKRRKTADSEIRRLNTRIKVLNEINEHLRSEIILLKNENVSIDASAKSTKDEDKINLAEKLRHTLNRLDECNLTCNELEEKLASALKRASASAVQLSKAAETISNLEQQIVHLKKEINKKNTEVEEKNIQIKNLESRVQEIAMESELKLLEANKQREAAEKKTVEVECKLKHAENMSKEVEYKVNEIEKKMSETKKFKKETAAHVKEAEKHVDGAEKMMEEAEKMKAEAERKSRDFQNFIDLMRKEVEDKMKETERRIKKTEKEKEELEKQVSKLKKRLLEAEKNKAEVEVKVKEGKETIRCMEEKLRELEIAMDHCNEEAQRKIKETQKRADIKAIELEEKMNERERSRKTEVEKKMAEAEKISRELEIGFRKQLEEAEKRIKRTKEVAEAAIKEAQEEFKKQEAELRQKIVDVENKKKTECEELLRKLDEAKLEASEFELELMRLTNEKIHLEEELKKLLDRESALIKDQEIKEKYEISIHKLEEKLTQLTLNKSQLASRLEEIESTNIDLVSRISAIRGKETMIVEQGFMSTSPSAFTPPGHCSPMSPFEKINPCGASEIEGNERFFRQGSTASDPGKRPLAIISMEAIAPPRRHLNSSPDLGIESDPGRFSSLETNQPTSIDPQIITLGLSEPVEIKKLELENAELRRRLTKTRQALEETLNQLSAANQRKKQVEKAICKQLHKTHHILKKARVNFELQDGGDALE